MTWIEHDGGPNPIPGARPEEFELRFRDGVEVLSDINSNGWCWEWNLIHLHPGCQITHYRILDHVQALRTEPQFSPAGRHAASAPILHERESMVELV